MASTGRGAVKRRREHIEGLCTRHKIDFVIAERGDQHGRAEVAARRITAPAVTMIRSYYIALHEIAHIVLGYDAGAPPAPQEARAWEWAFKHGLEPPSEGVRRMAFRAVWHYMIRTFDPCGGVFLPEGERVFPPPNDLFWRFMAKLEPDPARALYETAKLMARTGEFALAGSFAETEAQRKARERAERATATRDGHREQQKASVRGKPGAPSVPGDLARIGNGRVAHIVARAGHWETFVDGGWDKGAVLCGADGIVRPAPPDARLCGACQNIEPLEDLSGSNR